jgi:glycosyltransferase involved in cell wall biosynthesis
MVNSPGYVEHVQKGGAKRVELVPNGADPEMFNPFDTGIKFRQMHKLKNKFVALYAGAHGMSNDLDVVLDAAKLLETERDIQIVLLGDGKEKANLQARVVEMGLKNVLFLPPVPKNEMAAVLAGADACIAILKPIDEYKTTYPNKVFDYMAAGRPVVLAIEGVIQTVVEEADCGVFPKPGSARDMANAIAFLASDRDHAVTLGINGRRYLEEHFSRDAIAEKLENLISAMK